jgi:hypothetical protein
VSKTSLNLAILATFVLFGSCLVCTSSQSKAADNAQHSDTDSVKIQYFGRDAEGFLSGPTDDGYDQYVDKELSKELGSRFPGIQSILSKNTFYYTAPTNVAEIRANQDKITTLLISVSADLTREPEATKPILLLASARLSARLNTLDFSDPSWQPNRLALEKYNIRFVSSSNNGMVVDNPAVHKAWENLPDTPWTEDAFVLDLKNAFSCRDGSREYNIMIRRGRTFLQDHPHDPRDPWVDFVVGVTFADWFAVAEFSDLRQLHFMSKDDLAVGVSSAVRNSAIDYFLKASLGAPHSELGKAAAGAIKGLSSGLPPSEVAYACWAQ